MLYLESANGAIAIKIIFCYCTHIPFAPGFVAVFHNHSQQAVSLCSTAAYRQANAYTEFFSLMCVAGKWKRKWIDNAVMQFPPILETFIGTELGLQAKVTSGGLPDIRLLPGNRFVSFFAAGRV